MHQPQRNRMKGQERVSKVHLSTSWLKTNSDQFICKSQRKLIQNQGSVQILCTLKFQENREKSRIVIKLMRLIDWAIWASKINVPLFCNVFDHQTNLFRNHLDDLSTKSQENRNSWKVSHKEWEREKFLASLQDSNPEMIRTH